MGPLSPLPGRFGAQRRTAVVRRLAERYNTIVHWPEGNPGGHFVAMEEPADVVADLRAFFAKVDR